MKKFLSLLVFTLLLKNIVVAQGTWTATNCGGNNPVLDYVLINACGTQGYTEYFIFQNGSSPLSLSTINLTSTSNSGSTSTNFGGNVAGTTNIVTQLNTWATGCDPFVAVTGATTIPPGATVWGFPSSVGIGTITPAPSNLNTYCGQTIYVISGNYNPSNGNGFYNNNSGTIGFNLGPCTTTITYAASPDYITYGGGTVATYNTKLAGDCFPIPPVPCTPPTAPDYACSGWNVAVYEDGANFNLTNFKGFYTSTNDPVSSSPPAPIQIGSGSFGFSTLNDGYTLQGTPSSATGYNGCPVGVDGFTIWAKKTCFPCAYYKIFAKTYDDQLKIKVDVNGDGTPEFTSPQYTFGQITNQVVWEGFLNNSSKVDVQVMDFIPNGLDFRAEIDFLVQNITLNPTNNGPICAGQSVNLNSTVAPLGINPTPALAFSWTGPSGFTANTQNTVHNPSPGGLYTVSVTTPTGCTPITAQTTVALNSVSFTPIPDITACGGLTVPLAVTGTPPPTAAATYQWSGPGLSSTTSATPTATPPAPTSPNTSQVNNYAVTVTQGGCSWIDNFIITTYIVPTAPNLQTPITVCPGQPINLTVLSVNTGIPFPATSTFVPFPVTYTWTGPNSFTSSGNFGPGILPYTVTATAPMMPGTYTYNIVGALPIALSCTSAPAPVTVTVQAATPITLNAGQVCQNATLNLTPLITTAPAPAGTWSGTGVSGTTFNATGLAAGSYNVTFTTTGACPTSTVTAITVNTAPNPNTTQLGTICGGPPYTGTVTLNVDNNAAWTYLWSAGVAGAGNSVTVSQPGNYSVTVTNTATTCSVVKSFTVTATPLPTPTISGVNQLCDGGQTTLSVSPAGLTYNWAIGAGQSLGIGSTLNITGTNTQTIYSVTVTNAQGCSAIATKTIDPAAALSVNYTGTPVICGTNPAVITITGVYSNYQWTGGISTTATATISTAGNYTVTVTDASGCKGTLAFTVTQVAVNPVSIAGATQICTAQATTALTASAGFVSYAWNYLSQTGPAINPPAGGTYTVTATDNNGCKVTDSKTVTNFPVTLPNISVPGNATVCQNATKTLTVSGGTFTNYLWSPATVSGATPTVGAGTYNLTVTDNNGCKGVVSKTITTDVVTNSIAGNLNICAGGATTILSSANPFNQYAWSNSTSANAITVGAGTYTLTVTNLNGCTNVSSATVNNLPVPNGVVWGDSEYCAGSTLTLTTNPTFASYNWSGGGSTGTSPSFVANGTGTYSVTVTDANNCTAIFTKNITQNPLPTPTISGSTSICPGASTTLDATNPNSTYLWSNSATTPSITTNMVGTYTVTVTDNKGCKGTKSVVVTQNANLSITIAGTPNFCPGKSTTLNAGAGFTSYNWSANAGSAITPTVSVSAAGTYFVTVSNGTCNGTASIVVTQNPKPLVTIVGDSAICKGATGTLITDKTFSSYNWSTTGINQSTTYTGGTVYSVTVTDAVGCTNTDDITVKINDLPTPKIIGNTQICQGDSTELKTDKLYSGGYLWSNTSTNPSIFVNQFISYSVTVTDANGCKGDASTNISKVAALKPTIVGKKDFCEGESIDLTASAGFGKYDWSSGEKTPKITVSQGGTYIVTVSNGACTGIDSIKVVLNKKPVLVMSKDTTVCEGNQVTLKANAGSAIYEWSNAEKTPFISVDNAGTYTVTVTNLEGCSTIGSVKLLVNPTPKPVITTPNTICVGEKAVFALTEQYDKYLWSNGKTTDTIQVNDTNIYSVTVTSAEGCSAITSKSVAIKNNLNPIILGKTKFCDGASTTLTLDATYATYTWSTGEQTPTLTLNANANVIVTVTSASGCKGTASIDVTKVDNPTPTITGLLSVCSGKATTLNAGNFASYLWNDASSKQTLVVDKAGDYSVTVTDINGCKGENLVKVTENQAIGTLKDTLCKNDFKTVNGKKYDINNAAGQEIIAKGSIGGCDSTVNIQLYFRDEVSVQLESLGAVCSGNPATIKIKASGVSGSFSMVYEDEKGNKKTLNNVKDGDTFNVTPTETTTYTVKSISVGSAQCPSKLGSVRVDVSKINLKLKAVDYFGFGVSCGGKSDGSITANASGGVIPYQFVWSGGQTDITLNNLKPGTYKVTVTDGASCQSIDTVTLKSPTPIVADIKGLNPACASNPKGSVIINDITGGAGVYLYSLDGVKFSTIGTKPFKINNLDAGDYKVTVKDLNECSVEQNIKIDKGAFIKVDLGPDVTLEYGDSVVITPTADFQMKNISWTNAKYLSCDTCQFPLAKPKVTTGFKVTVFDTNGCSTTDDIIVFVLNPRNVFVPTVFSPNSDGSNDVLKVFVGKNAVKINFFRVYDRWGNVVYEDLNFTRDQVNEATRGWDGTFRGQMMNPAVFTYGLEVEYNDGEKRMYKGDFSLISKN